MYRTTKEQIISGLHLGVNLGLFLIAAMLTGDGWKRVFDTSNGHEIVGWLELVLATVILYFTSHVWRLLLGGIALAGIFKSLVMVITGANLYPVQFQVSNPRREGIEFLIYCVALVLLLFQFGETKPTIFDKIALTACVLFFGGPAKGPDFSPWLLVGPFLLATSWAFKRSSRASSPD